LQFAGRERSEAEKEPIMLTEGCFLGSCWGIKYCLSARIGVKRETTPINLDS